MLERAGKITLEEIHGGLFYYRVARTDKEVMIVGTETLSNDKEDMFIFNVDRGEDRGIVGIEIIDFESFMIWATSKLTIEKGERENNES